MNFSFGRKLALGGLFAAALLTYACDNSKQDNEKAVNDYNAYVTRMEGERAQWDADSAYWSNHEAEYNKMRADVDARYDKMDEANRARVDSIRMRYDRIKTEYSEARQQRAEQMNRQNRENELRTAIFGSEAAADLSNVNGSNIRSYYEKLVNTVAANQDSYTPADWDYIKAWYEKLDALKNKFEHNGLSTKDNLAIAGLKIKYDAIRIPGRIESKVDEKDKEQTEDLNKK